MRSWAPLCLMLAACGGDGASDPDAASVPVIAEPGVRSWRMNRTAYLRTVEDVLGLQASAHLLPEDPEFSGFDNNASALTLSDADVESWVVVAEQLARWAVADPSMPVEVALSGGMVELNEGVVQGEGILLTGGPGELITTLFAPAKGLYDLEVIGSIGVELESGRGPNLWIDERTELLDAMVSGQGWASQIDLESGPHRIRLSANIEARPHDLELGAIRLVPVDPDARNATWEGLQAECTPAGDDLESWRVCAEVLLVPRALRMWSWPAERRDVDGVLMQVSAAHAEGQDWPTALERGFLRLLTSPFFLVRSEPTGAHEGWTQRHVAARLARFLWSSVPDEALLQAADDAEDGWVGAETRRLLADPRADAFVERFTAQWLGTKNVYSAARDATRYPAWSPELVDAMTAEVEALFRDLVARDLPATDLLLATRGSVQAPLDALYGLPRAGEDVDLAPVGRGGILGAAGVLAGNSHRLRTSVVRRGAWTLTQLLCDPPKPPPPDVPLAPEVDDPRAAADLHQTDPVCSGCHAEIDPYGLPLEHFDEIGAFRQAYESGVLVDASAELPGGRSIYGMRELASALAEDERFEPCVVQQLTTYALGRSPTETELAGLPSSGLRLGALVEAITSSAAFRAPVGGVP